MFQISGFPGHGFRLGWGIRWESILWNLDVRFGVYGWSGFQVLGTRKVGLEGMEVWKVWCFWALIYLLGIFLVFSLGGDTVQGR